MPRQRRAVEHSVHGIDVGLRNVDFWRWLHTCGRDAFHQPLPGQHRRVVRVSQFASSHVGATAYRSIRHKMQLIVFPTSRITIVDTSARPKKGVEQSN